LLCVKARLTEQESSNWFEMSFVRFFEKDRQVIPRWHTYPMARWLRMTLSGRADSDERLKDDAYEQLTWLGMLLL